MTEFVPFFFKCLNLAVFGGLCYYFFRTKVVPILQEQMREKREHATVLQMQQEARENSLANLSVELHEQKLTEQRLIEKTTMWSQAVNQQHALLERERQRCELLFVNRSRMRVEYASQDRVIARVMPRVICTLEERARGYYDNSAQVNRAFVDLVNKIKTRAS